MVALQLEIGMSDTGPRLSQAEAKLTKQPLALADAQLDGESLRNESGERLAVPQVASEPEAPRRVAQGLLDGFDLFRLEPTGPPAPLAIDQAPKPVPLEAPHPILHGARRIAEQPGHFPAAHPLRHQQ